MPKPKSSVIYKPITSQKLQNLALVTKKCEMCCRAPKTTWQRRHGLWPGKTTSYILKFFEFWKKKTMSSTVHVNQARAKSSLLPISFSQIFLWPKSDCDGWYLRSILLFHTAPWEELMISWTDDVENTELKV
jgi:hypothetical protein